MRGGADVPLLFLCSSKNWFILPSLLSPYDNSLLCNAFLWMEQWKTPFTPSQKIKLFIAPTVEEEFFFLLQLLGNSSWCFVPIAFTIYFRLRDFLVWRRERMFSGFLSQFLDDTQRVKLWWQEWMQICQYIERKEPFFWFFFKNSCNIQKIYTFEEIIFLSSVALSKRKRIFAVSGWRNGRICRKRFLLYPKNRNRQFQTRG